MSGSTTGIKDLTKLTNWVSALLWILAATSCVALITGTLEHDVLTKMRDGTFSSQEQMIAAAEASDWRQQIVGGLQVVCALAGGILILMWIYRANYNAHQLGARQMRFTPGWSVGWYFIPIATLWLPYQSMREIWKCSANPRGWFAEPVPRLMGAWWFCWLVSNFLYNGAARYLSRANEIDELLIGNVVTRAADALEITNCVLLLTIVKKIHSVQIEQAFRITEQNSKQPSETDLISHASSTGLNEK